MGIFDKFFRKKQGVPKNEVVEETTQTDKIPNNETKVEIVEKLNIDISQASEKFQHLSGGIIGFLTNKLQEIHNLEQEIFDRSQALKNPEEPNQLQPGERELWAEYKQRRKEITTPVYLKPPEEGSRSFGKPTKYEYLTYPDTKIIFIMKSANRAVIETRYRYGGDRKEQFVLKKDVSGWKIDTKKYGFPDEDTWYKDEL